MKGCAFWNTLFLPVRIIFSHEVVNRLGLRSLRDERCDVALQHARGRLLDIGCGNNQLVKQYANDSVGVDVHDFGSGALLVEDSSHLPFEDESFQTVSFVACLNHIPNRAAVLKEAHRLLSSNGIVLITMLSPFIGTLRHKLAWWDKDQTERGMKEGEVMGMSHDSITSLVESQSFRLVERSRFCLGLNSLYIFEKCSHGQGRHD
jgi:ubiquinone/menaquinone biosynthesis C-methylase UbiE